MTKEEYVRERMQMESLAATMTGTRVKWAREDMRDGKIDGQERREIEQHALKTHRMRRGPDITF